MATETTLFKGSDEEGPPVVCLSPEVASVQPQGMSSSGKEREKESVYKTKVMQFMGRTTPIVLQNENGPCPLLAISNVLLLRNNLNLSSDVAEVSQERLLSLIAERLIDSNSNVKDKDAGYLENQQQNVADAIDLLPRLATGIDVNIKFRRIDDFEFTPECAIFDLLDIPLYHGWIVDPQDLDTASAIGSKSYNSLTGELVALETQNMDAQTNSFIEEDSVDFVAATTAVLGVPSPCLSKTTSFDDSSHVNSCLERGKLGDIEEEMELLRVLKVSEDESSRLAINSVVGSDSDENRVMMSNDSTLDKCHGMSNDIKESVVPSLMDECTSSNINITDHNDHFNVFDLGENFDCSDVNKNMVEMLQSKGMVHSLSTDHQDVALPQEGIKFESTVALGASQLPEMIVKNEISHSFSLNQESGSSSDWHQTKDATDTLNPSLDGSEPLYEGEETIIDSDPTVPVSEEPMYEGEIVLARQVDASGVAAANITPREGELIKNFLKNSANQLTFYGLFCLQEGLKERELCVFFRNNHFSTMFKYEGQLYLLATDQGYINEPDLVWEKLNEVNGDTLFMTSTFKEFKIENDVNGSWNEHSALASTADYLASIDNGAQVGLDMNSDFQLAIALQQQEFEQQQQQQEQPPRENTQQQPLGPSRLITGPQRPSSGGRTSSSSKPESKLKDKCIVM